MTGFLVVFIRLALFIGITVRILVVITEVVVVTVDMVDVIGRHVRNCKSWFKSTSCVINETLPGWFSLVDKGGRSNIG